MMYKILYSVAAKNDLKSIYEYIAYELFVPETAYSQVDRIIRAIGSLETFPYRCKIYDKEPWSSKGLRFLTVDNYIVFYYPIEEDRVVRIIRIIYSGRDIKIELNN